MVAALVVEECDQIFPTSGIGACAGCATPKYLQSDFVDGQVTASLQIAFSASRAPISEPIPRPQRVPQDGSLSPRGSRRRPPRGSARSPHSPANPGTYAE